MSPAGHRGSAAAPLSPPAASSCGLAGSVQPADPDGVTETMTKSVPPVVVVTIHKHYHFVHYMKVQKPSFLIHSSAGLFQKGRDAVGEFSRSVATLPVIGKTDLKSGGRSGRPGRHLREQTANSEFANSVGRFLRHSAAGTYQNGLSGNAELPPEGGRFCKELNNPRRTAWRGSERDGGSRRNSRHRRSNTCSRSSA